MDDEKSEHSYSSEREYNHFEKQVMKYLRALALKFYTLHESVQCMQATIIELGRANGKAYKQVKVVINELATATEDVVHDISSAQGTVRTLAWVDYDDDGDVMNAFR